MPLFRHTTKEFPILLTAFALLLFAVTATSVSAKLHCKQQRMQVGLQLYSVREACAKDLPGTLKAIAKMGYTGVEFAGFHGRSAEELRRLLDENGLKCYGAHVAPESLVGDNLKKTVAFNKTLGNKLLMLLGNPLEPCDTRAKIIEVAKTFSDIAKRLAPYKMTVGYHNHESEFKSVEGDLIWNIFIANTDKRVAIQFDTGNALEGGVQAAPFLAKHSRRLLSVHVKDYSSTNPKALLGEGDEHWTEVLPLILKKGGVRWLIIEQNNYPYPPLESVERCLRNFEKMVEDSTRQE